MTMDKQSVSAHIDTFARDAMPTQDEQPEYLFKPDSLQFPDQLNCAAELLDNKVAQGLGDKIAIKSDECSWSYSELLAYANRIAHVLRGDLNLIPGNRVLLRAPNTPMMAACWLAVIKVGGIVVATMPLLRADDLEPVINKAKIEFALCDKRLQEELELVQQRTPHLKTVCFFNANGDTDAGTELEQLMLTKPVTFNNVDTTSDDVALIAFTSGTTGQPKGTMHFHRDVMAMCICVGDELIKPTVNDIFIGSPPFAFTFGLGMLLAIPLHAGATCALVEKPSPDNLAQAINDFKATICSTAPTAYRALLNNIDKYDLSSLTTTVSAGEHLPLAIYQEWEAATGLKMINGLGATEMIHIFISARDGEIRPGSTGKAINGYEVCILGDDGKALPPRLWVGWPSRVQRHVNIWLTKDKKIML